MEMQVITIIKSIKSIKFINHTFAISYFLYDILIEGEEWEIMRGMWYYDGSWIPLETEHSKVIEDVHLKLFQKEGNNQSSSKCEINVSQSCKSKLLPFFHQFILKFI